MTIEHRLHDAEHLLLWQLHGRSTLRTRGAVVRIRPDHAAWVPAGVSHSLQVGANSVIFPFLFDRAHSTIADTGELAVTPALRQVLLTLTQFQVAIIRPECDVERRALRMIHEAFVPAGSLLPTPTTPAARTVAAALRRDPADRRSVAELAASAYVSTRSLERDFRAGTGMTVQSWRTRLRMQSATELLRARVPVAAVAARVGDQDESAFRRAFKSSFGITPADYSRTGGDRVASLG